MRPLSEELGDGQDATPSDIVEPIAIVGIASRFAQDAVSVEDLWDILLQSRSTWSPIPKDRLNSYAFYHPDPEHGGTFHVQGGHFLAEDPAHFDSSFFHMTKNEVLTLDPQQRLVMENVYHALENAGIPLDRAIGSNTSVFVSGFNHDYLGILNSDPETTIKYKPTGVSNSIISNRVSWFFDFKGPSMTIDTACSSSLVALHLAVQSLRSRETTMSVVSGVNILENPVETTGFSHHGLLGAHGRSFSFDDRAEGYARGEGVGTVILKHLKDAVRDGDVIRAVIRETGVNQDGRTPGITVPNAEAQESLIRQVYQRAGLNMQQTRYVEAHGTGTRTGDPIEAKALARAFRCQRDGPLHIGSIKSTLGHVEGGSGVASLMKAIFILESGIIPATYDLQRVNSEILTEDWNINFPSESMPWPTSGLRRVSINSFGIGGTNAHCVLDDAYNYFNERCYSAAHNTSPVVRPFKTVENQHLPLPKANGDPSLCDPGSAYDSDDTASEVDFSETPTTQSHATTPLLKAVPIPERPIELPKIFILTAFDEDGVKRNASSYSRYVKWKRRQTGKNDELLQDLSFTISAKRSVFPWKSFVTASTTSELQWNLSEGNYSKPFRADTPPDVYFVFTGQGAQYCAMGKSLLTYPVFRSSMEAASEYIRSLGSPWSLLDEHAADELASRVDIPEIAQPLCTALQIALVELLASWEIFPTCVTGHSSGEIAAAYSSGKISRESAWKVAYLRGCLSSRQQSANGAMMAVGLDASQLHPYIQSVREKVHGEIKIACYNSPTNNTVSGDEALIDELQAVLEKDSIFVRKLKVRNAYHSAHMEIIADEYLHLMGCLKLGKRLSLPHPVRMFSTLTGKELTEHWLPTQYWVDNMVSPVRFTDGLNAMVSRTIEDTDGASKFSFILEIGPHSTLQSAIKDTLSSDISQAKIRYLAVLRRNDPTLNPLLSTIGFLAASGYKLDIHGINFASCEKVKTVGKLIINLPAYSFKHTEKILYESRLSKNLRFRKFPRHDLFGAPVTDWNANAPRWRHFVRLDENPWLKHHVVTGNYVYPGVGYLVMAIEASRQLVGEKSITGFQLQQASIRRALIVPDTKQGIEVCVSMTTESSSEFRVCRRFQINSYNETSEEWTEHCTGLILVEEGYSAGSISNCPEAKAEAQVWWNKFENLHEVCNRPIDFSKSYDTLLKAGLDFGPLFRNLHDVRITDSGLGEMTGVVTVPDIAESMPKKYAHPHLIHPATMDSMIHMMIAAVLDFTGKPSLDKIMLPTFIHDMWVSADLGSTPGSKFEGHASVRASASEKFEGQIRVFDPDSKAHWISMNGIELTPLETAVGTNFKRQLCTTIEWKPDVNFLNSETALRLSQISHRNRDQDVFWVKRLQLATMIFVTDALKELQGIDVTSLQPHLRRFYDWMVHVQRNLFNDKIIHLTLLEVETYSRDKSLREAIFHELENHNADGALTVRMGRNVASVMRQEIDPLHLMFGQDSLMEEVYKGTLLLCNIPQHLQSHLSLLRHQRSRLRVIEIGGGTGSLTAEVLKVLSPKCDPQNESIASYTFTDVSSSFFEKAKERFQAWKSIMTFKSFDLEKDPDVQGLETAGYDIIFAGNVIHATSDLKATLKRLRSLLRPGGQLIMQEGIRQDFLWYPLAFGQLPGWWLGDEPVRQWCPYIPVSAWDSLLVESGFSGVDIEYPGCEHEDLSWQSLIISSALDVTKQIPRNVYIICSGAAETVDVADFICQILKDDDRFHVTVLKVTELDRATLRGSLCISLLDMENPVLSSIEDDDYNTLKKMLLQCQQLLWIALDLADQPFVGTSMGLLRTIRSERGSDDSNIVTLAVADCFNVSAEDLAISSYAIIKHQFDIRESRDRHAEYLLRNNMIHIGRVRDFENADRFLSFQSPCPPTEVQRIGDLQRPVRLENPGSAIADSRWITDVQHKQPLSDTQILIDIRAVGYNPSPDRLNVPAEAAGVVTKVGLAVRDLTIGDNVVFLIGGTASGHFQTSMRIEQAMAIKIGESIPLEIAASLPATFAVAIYGVGYIARLSSSDTVLVHAGADALGQAALQYAKVIGAEIYTTVSTVEDRRLLIEVYGIPDDHIFATNYFEFRKGIMRCTNGAGVDVIFNTLTGELQQECLPCLAAFGRFVNASGKAFQPHTNLAPASALQSMSISNIDIDLLVRHRPRIVRDLIQETLHLYTQGKLSEIQPLRVLNFTQIQSGIRSVQDGQSSGKIVFVPDPADRIPVVPEPLPPLQFDAGASYILAGGLGGLGRSIARWMAARGAKSLVFLSRSRNSSETTTKLVSDLKRMGCNVRIFVCDILDRHNLRLALEDCHSVLPPIKGCIQCSMVLQDATFEGMTYDTWQTAVQPKVQGSWNLHKILPSDLDFFVMLSSVAGIFGNRGQANYAAGNTFQDALAAYRTARGMKASVIDLGSVSNVGWVSENRQKMTTRSENLFELLHENEVHDAIEFMIDPRQNKGHDHSGQPQSQLILGLPTAEICRQNNAPSPSYLNFSLFTHQRSTAVMDHAEMGEQVTTIRTATLLAATATFSEAVEVVSDGIVEKLSALLAIPVSEIDAQRFGFSSIDSLVALEFRSWIMKELDAELSVLDIMGAQNIRSLSEKVAGSRKTVEK